MLKSSRPVATWTSSLSMRCDLKCSYTPSGSTKPSRQSSDCAAAEMISTMTCCLMERRYTMKSSSVTASMNSMIPSNDACGPGDQKNRHGRPTSREQRQLHAAPRAPSLQPGRTALCTKLGASYAYANFLKKYPRSGIPIATSASDALWPHVQGSVYVLRHATCGVCSGRTLVPAAPLHSLPTRHLQRRRAHPRR
jgi:rRNA maturation protein Nop10